ncbi:MAG: hypothetical protein ACXWO3_09785, partial [Isosphaeraceae bacterium]
MVQTQVTAQGCLGSTPEGRRPQIRGWRAGGSLAVASSTPATPLLAPAKIRELNHAQAWFKNAHFRVTLGLSARTLIGPALERVYAS